MLSLPLRNWFLTALVATAVLLPLSSKVARANNLSSSLSSVPRSRDVAQGNSPSDRERQLERQREAERALKEGERLRREIRNSGFSGGDLERRVNEQVTKIRESGTNPQTVRDAATELQRLRDEKNRLRYYYDPYYYPYYNDYYYIRTITAPIIFTTPAIDPTGNIYFTDTTPATPTPEPVAPPAYTPIEDNYPPTVTPENNQKFTISAGFKDGLINPAIGIRWNNIGLEFGAIFNEDSLPGILNDFSLPSNFLFNDLGEKKTSAQYGSDVLGYYDVNPDVSLYGGVGLYFQSKSRIAQSQATNELYKQTDTTTITPAVTVGVDYNISDAMNVGLGYHSLRGINGRIGIRF
jgi:hypothetical protein